MANTYYDSQLTAAEIQAALEAIAGVIEPANNGKILAIEDGKIAPKSVTEYIDLNLQAKTVTPSASQQVVAPDSGYNGLSTVTVNGDADLVAGNIKKDVNIFGVTGSYEGSAPSLQSKNVTPGAAQQTVQPDSGYDGLSSVVVNGDADLVAGNIKKDVEIFGVTGSYEGGSGGSVFAFIKVTYLAGDTVVATNGETTLTSDTSGSYVFEIPYSNSNTWTVTSTNYGNAVTFTLTYGDSGSAAFDVYILKSTNISPAPTIELDLSGANPVITVSDTIGHSNSEGIIFSSPLYSKMHGNGNSGQYGTCNTTASLPTIVTNGTGRGSFYGAGYTSTVTKNDSYPYFYITFRNTSTLSFSCTLSN